MYKLVFCYPSRAKENIGIEVLYGPLSLAYLAGHTPDYYKISLYDEYVGEDMDPETVDADLVAVSSLTSGISRAYEIGDILKKRGITCVIGGAHVTALPEEALEHFDAVIMGEGENPWKEFLKDFENNRIRKTYYGPMNVSLESLGTPDRNFIHKNYHYPTVNTSRGCPYGCTYCYLTVFKDRKYRVIPHETVLDDLESLRDESIIIITDENFIGYTQDIIDDRKNLLRKMINRKFRFLWGCQTTVSLADDPELMDLMYQAGCRAVFIGFESANPEDLAEVGKKHNLGIDYKEIVKRLHKHKIGVIASCILGMDNHVNGYHKQLIKELKEINADFVRVFLITAWPGTPLYKKLQASGRVIKEWDMVRKDIPSILYKHYTHNEIINARKEVMNSFFNNRNILKVILRWILIDRSLIPTFIKLSYRNRSSERIRNSRAFTYSKE
jgi:radical SAM superfamily enzyme YgiQ (UPF0313 family)